MNIISDCLVIKNYFVKHMFIVFGFTKRGSKKLFFSATAIFFWQSSFCDIRIRDYMTKIPWNQFPFHETDLVNVAWKSISRNISFETHCRVNLLSPILSQKFREINFITKCICMNTATVFTKIFFQISSQSKSLVKKKIFVISTLCHTYWIDNSFS